MITTAEEFLNNLWLINNDGNTPFKAALLPSDETIYSINLENRMIEGPKELSVEGDHASETLYFLVDRMYGDTDLSTTTCVIQYINAIGEEGFQIVPFYDINTFSSQVTNDYIEAYVTETNYRPNKYYIYENEEYIISLEGFDKNQTYYVFNNVSLNKKYIKANVTEDNYFPNIFYYFDNNDLTYKISDMPYNDEEVYYINIEKRIIKAHVEYSNYKRNTYYVLNEKNELELSTDEYIQGKEYYIILDKPKILFPWIISNHVSKEPGIIQYAIRFFKCDGDKQIITYDLNTKVAQSIILQGLRVDIQDEDFNNTIITSPTVLEEIYSLINSRKDLCWIEA